MDGINAAQRYPDKIFFHCSGFKRSPNLATYMADFHQVYYLNGIMAGALTKSGKIGYVGTFPTPELKRHINAFTFRSASSNQAEVNVRWLQSAWYDPQGAKEAAGPGWPREWTFLAFTEDPAAVAQVAEEK